MQRIAALSLLGLLLLSPSAGANRGEELYYDICLRCHGDWRDDGPERSYKSWELTVYRMQSYDHFSDEEAELIIGFLTGTQSEEETEPEEPAPAETTQADLAGGAEQPEDPARQERLARTRQIAEARLWNPSAGWLTFGRWLGYAAVASLVALALTGLARKPLARSFKWVHTSLGAALLVLIAGHALIDLAEYGAPPVLWLWFGIAASVLPAVGLGTGYLRRLLGRMFRPVHFGFAIAGLALALLHWIWIYI